MIVAAIVVLVDQLTKIWAVAALSDGPIDVFGEVFRLRLTRNPGAAFSSFTGGGPVLGVLAAIVAIAIVFVLPKIELPIDRFAMALIMGGALGNFVDRIFRGDGVLDGAVVDFLDLSFWPTFNFADSAITVGVVLMLVSALFTREPTVADATDDSVASPYLDAEMIEKEPAP